MTYVVISSFGFDVDFLLRRISKGKPDRVVCIGLYVDEGGWARVEKAFTLLNHYCLSSSLSCHLEKVSLEKLMESIRSILTREASNATKVELFLTGGPRIVVVASLIVALTLPSDTLEKIKVVVEGETFDATYGVDLKSLTRFLRLDKREKDIIAKLLEHEAGLKVTELSRETRLPRASVYRIVERLMNLGLVIEENDKLLVSNSLRDLFKIYVS